MNVSAQEEEALKATIISHARAVYGPKYPADSVFDVITGTGTESGDTVSFIIVYPKTKPLFPSSEVSGKFDTIIHSGKAYSLSISYNKLLSYLRREVSKTIQKECKEVGVDMG